MKCEHPINLQSMPGERRVGKLWKAQPTEHKWTCHSHPLHFGFVQDTHSWNQQARSVPSTCIARREINITQASTKQCQQHIFVCVILFFFFFTILWKHQHIKIRGLLIKRMLAYRLGKKLMSWHHLMSVYKHTFDIRLLFQYFWCTLCISLLSVKKKVSS